MSGRGRGRGRGRGGAPLSQSKLMLQRSAKEAGLDERHAILDLTRPTLYADFVWHSSGDPRNSVTTNSNDGAMSSSLKRDPSAATAATSESTTSPEGLQITKRSASTRNLVNKQREFMERFAASPYFITARPASDIIRNYSYRSLNDKRLHQPLDPDAAVLEAMGKKLSNDERYVPSELGPSRALLLARKRKAAAEAANDKSKLRNKRTNNLDTWEQREKSRKESGDENPESQIARDPDEEEHDEDILGADDAMEDEGDDYNQDYYASEDDDDSDGGGDGEAVF